MDGSKLRRTIRRRQTGMRTTKSHLGVRDAVLKLVVENQDLNSILGELREKQVHGHIIGSENREQDVEKEQSHVLDASCVSSLLASFKHQSGLTGLPLSVVSAEKCSSLLLEIVNDGGYEEHRSNQIFCSSELLEGLNVLVKAITQLANDPVQFDKTHFTDCIKNKVSFPLELVWILHKHAIVTFDLFIKENLSNGTVYKKLTKDILFLMIGRYPPEKEDLARRILSDLVIILVGNAFPGDDSTKMSAEEKSLREAYQLLIGTVFDGVFDHCLREGDGLVVLKMSWIDVPGTSLKQFLSSQLLNLLCYKPTWTVTQAVTMQEMWNSSKTSGPLTQLFKELSSGLDTKTLIDILKRTLEEEEVNWKTTLMFASFLVLNSVDAKTQYKELLDYFLQEAFESIEQEGLISAFLLARQAASEGTHAFMSYKDWFQSTFCHTDHPHLSSKKEVTFFLSFLTNLVPLEPAQFLKVHVQHSSFVPAKYNVLLDDYITLAKTRLTDLKVPWDSTGIFKRPSTDTTGQAKNPVEADVSRAVETFEQTGKIPSTVMQAIMFKRKYFHCYFLPSLLVPRVLPDIPDSKMKLILALNEANKIPADQYREYERKCGEMLEDLLEGAFSEDVVMEELLEPMDALKAHTKKLQEMIKSDLDEAAMRRQLSMLSDSLKTLVSEGQSSEEIVNLEEGALDGKLVEIVDVLLNCFCNAASGATDITERDRGTLQWEETFVVMLGGHPSIHRTLLKRIWSTLTVKSSESEMSDLDLSGLCAVLHVHQLQGMFPQVTTNKLTGHHTLLEAVIQELPHSTAEEMASLLRFFYGVLQSLHRLDNSCPRNDHVPQDLLLKFGYLVERFKKASIHDQKQLIEETRFQDMVNFSTSAVFSEMTKSAENLNLHLWCLWELEVDPHMDILSDVNRCYYHRHVLLSEFLPLLQPPDNSNVHWTACKTIINAILDHNYQQQLNPGEGRRNCTTTREMTKLAAELLLMMPQEQVIYSGKLHLISIIEDRYNKDTEETDPVLVPSLCEERVRTFISIILCLPPVFILVNHPSQTVNDHLCSHLARFLESNRQHMMEESSTLPLLLTAHIFQGVVSMISSSSSIDGVLDKLVMASPLLKTSLMHHWSKLRPLLPKKLPTSDVFKKFEDSHKLSLMVMSNLGLTPTVNVTNSDLVATAVYSNIIEGQELSDEWWRRLVCLQSETNVNRDMFFHLGQFLANQIAWAILHQSDTSHHYFKMLTKLLSQDHSLIVEIFKGGSLLSSRVFHPSAVSLHPVVFFRCFEDCDSAVWAAVPSSLFLTVALKCHINIRDLYLQSTNEDSNGASVEVFSMERLTVYNDIIRRLIEKSPSEVIKDLPVDLINRCSPLVHSYLRAQPL